MQGWFKIDKGKDCNVGHPLITLRSNSVSGFSFVFFFLFQNPSVTFTSENQGRSSSKSFRTLLTTPFHSPLLQTVRAKSVESPYTSLGSAHSSYASIRQQPNGLYSSLRAKAERANAMHESKSKGKNF